MLYWIFIKSDFKCAKIDLCVKINELFFLFDFAIGEQITDN